jgi:hypothetical protein
VSVGGALGGAFAANIAPLLLTPHIEYMLLIVHAGVARPGGGNRLHRAPAVALAALAAVVLTLGARALTPGGAWPLLSLAPPTCLLPVRPAR